MEAHKARKARGEECLTMKMNTRNELHSDVTNNSHIYKLICASKCDRSYTNMF
jgi:hypothetical protein